MDTEVAKAFIGSIPEMYDVHLVPLILECYAADLAARLSRRPLSRLLEIAAGTGVVTRALASTLHPSISIVATDLNQAMLDRAAAVGTKRPAQWRHADAMALPFEDGAFDAVVCQFGVMFFPDRVTPTFIDCATLSTVSFDLATCSATWAFTTALPDGNYRATLPAGSVSDAGGNKNS